VDQHKALEFPKADLLVSPYVLGAWLGDGGSTYGAIVHDKKDTQSIEEISKFYKVGSEQIHKTTEVVTTYFLDLITDIRSLGLFGNKHIPNEYKFSSIEQRLELLAGLIDTDGYGYEDQRNNTRDGRYRFINCNKRLVDDVVEIIRSLGWKACVTETQPALSSSGIQGKQVVYQVGFSPDRELPVKIPRKKIHCQAKDHRLAITKVSLCSAEVAKCIEVDSSDGLYLSLARIFT
jgi:hypothetical protein